MPSYSRESYWLCCCGGKRLELERWIVAFLVVLWISFWIYMTNKNLFLTCKWKHLYKILKSFGTMCVQLLLTTRTFKSEALYHHSVARFNPPKLAQVPGQSSLLPIMKKNTNNCQSLLFVLLGQALHNFIHNTYILSKSVSPFKYWLSMRHTFRGCS